LVLLLDLQVLLDHRSEGGLWGLGRHRRSTSIRLFYAQPFRLYFFISIAGNPSRTMTGGNAAIVD
jgi:hypothetical protein